MSRDSSWFSSLRRRASAAAAMGSNSGSLSAPLPCESPPSSLEPPEPPRLRLGPPADADFDLLRSALPAASSESDESSSSLSSSSEEDPSSLLESPISSEQKERKIPIYSEK